MMKSRFVGEKECGAFKELVSTEVWSDDTNVYIVATGERF